MAKLKADAGSIQLKESFSKIPNNLLTDEHHTRPRLGRHLTLLLMAEVKMLSHPDEKEWAVMAKLAFASFGEVLASFKIKRKCRSAVLGCAGLKLEPKRLSPLASVRDSSLRRRSNGCTTLPSMTTFGLSTTGRCQQTLPLPAPLTPNSGQKRRF